MITDIASILFDVSGFVFLFLGIFNRGSTGFYNQDHLTILYCIRNVLVAMCFFLLAFFTNQ